MYIYVWYVHWSIRTNSWQIYPFVIYLRTYMLNKHIIYLFLWIILDREEKRNSYYNIDPYSTAVLPRIYSGTILSFYNFYGSGMIYYGKMIDSFNNFGHVLFCMSHLHFHMLHTYVRICSFDTKYWKNQKFTDLSYLKTRNKLG